MSTREQFIDIYKKYIKREGSVELLSWLESTDFFEAPASTRFHGSNAGGLVVHSLSVFYEAMRLKSLYAKYCGEISDESVAICALLHDVCKIGCYKIEMRNVKENGSWIQKPFYKFEEDFKFGGHGSKSVFLVQKCIRLSDGEAAAINSHMGAWDVKETRKISEVYSNNILAWIIHVADEASSFIVRV